MSEGTAFAVSPCAAHDGKFIYPVDGLGAWWPALLVDAETGKVLDKDDPRPAETTTKLLCVPCAQQVEKECERQGLPQAWAPFWAKGGAKWARR